MNGMKPESFHTGILYLCVYIQFLSSLAEFDHFLDKDPKNFMFSLGYFNIFASLMNGGFPIEFTLSNHLRTK